MLSRVIARRFSTSLRRFDYAQEGRPGANLPFGSRFDNKYTFTAGACAFFGSAMAIPFYIIYLRADQVDK